MSGILTEKLRQLGNLPLLTALRLLDRLHMTVDELPQVPGGHRQYTRKLEKIRRRMRKASQRGQHYHG